MSDAPGKNRVFFGICLLVLAAAMAFLAWEVRQTRLSVERRLRNLEAAYDRSVAALARKEQQLVEAGSKVRETIEKTDELAEKAKSALHKAKDMTGKAREILNPAPLPPPTEPNPGEEKK